MSGTGMTKADGVTAFDDANVVDGSVPAKKRGPLAVVLALSLVLALAVLTFFLFILPTLGSPWGANAAPDLAVLDTPQGPEDHNEHIADAFGDPANGDHALVPGTLRLLGTGEQGTYWVARNQGGDICYWYELGESSTMGSVCTNPERFNAEGIGSKTSDVANGVTIESYLLPDRAVPSDSPQYVVELPGVIIVNPGIPNYTRFEIPASTGDPISVNTLGPL